ncbi:hypothetical protein [Prosthecobacter fluviatilis]|uniref:Uncharacterized protein n=1 Tax=Prosthecobacter fluviatilis TaxID=445931 RepID=A0ABW0KW14_9BACT
MKRQTLMVLMMVMLCGVGSFAADPFEFIPNQRPAGEPLAKLPGGIPSTEGKVTLFADYARAVKGQDVDVYLINRSDRDIVLGSQDGDVYLKLETRKEDGSWVRVQPHAFSWCGNSYGRMKVKKDCFCKINGHQPKEGKPATIRFRLYMQGRLDLATDAGEGLVSEKEAEQAATDVLAVEKGSFEFVRDIATGARTIVNTMDHNKDMQEIAIMALGSGRFPKEKVEPLLDEIGRRFPGKLADVTYARSRLIEKDLKK